MPFRQGAVLYFTTNMTENPFRCPYHSSCLAVGTTFLTWNDIRGTSVIGVCKKHLPEYMAAEFYPKREQYREITFEEAIIIDVMKS
jgi:hypothetical protein